MSAVDEIINDIPMAQLATELNVDEQTAEAAARQAIPALLGGISANATDPGGEASLAGALSEHSADLIDGGVNLQQVDTADGQAIVTNIFGSNTDQVAQRIGGGASLGGGTGIDTNALVKKLLPILAPIVLSYLAKQVKGTRYGDILGPILSGASGGSGQGGALKDVLDQIIGGRQTGPAADSGQDGGGRSILDLLGDLLGGGKR